MYYVNMSMCVRWRSVCMPSVAIDILNKNEATQWINIWIKTNVTEQKT